MLASGIRVGVRLPALLVATLVMMLVYGLAPRSARRWRRRVQIVWCRCLCGLTGLRVRVIGAPNTAGVTVFCANHVSYLDIAVLSRHLEGTFVAKSEVGRWPVFGSIAKLTGTILVDRRPAKARVQRAEIVEHLANRENLILFPEGTSTDGAGVAPFKSALLDIAAAGQRTSGGDGMPAIHVQPVSVAYVRDRGGEPLTGPRRALYCWYGDMTLAPHVLRVLGLPGADVELRLHPPLPAAKFADRKALTRACERVVAEGVAASHGAADVQHTHGAAAE